jgi:hypothetical protein
MLWTITCRRLRRDRRGISNIIVVVLSLVIILAIVSNIVLWNYEMTQLDWEKMKENIIITNVESGSDLPWFTAQSEYTVNTGSKTEGTYINTQVVDGSFESFMGTSDGGSSNVTLINAESFEGSWPPSGWSETSRWNKENGYAYDESYSADFDGGSGGQSGYLTSPSMDCSDSDAIYVDFWWYDRNLDNDDFELEYYDGSSWDNYQDLNQLESGNGWHHYTEAVTDSQYFVSNFQIRWWAKSVSSSETGCVDLVTVKKSAGISLSSLDLTGQYTINLSTYPLANIQTIEIQLRYRADDSSENWYLQAYNWTASTYSDVGFNSTAGHTPTTGWDYYAVNLTDTWQSYVNSYGQVSVKFADQNADSEQTSIDIDFLGVRVKMDGSQFTFENDASLTVHLVSLWIINSTDRQRYDINVFVNSAETKNYLHADVSLPTGSYTVKVVTERGNMAVYSGS